MPDTVGFWMLPELRNQFSGTPNDILMVYGCFFTKHVITYYNDKKKSLLNSTEKGTNSHIYKHFCVV